ncbi:MAG: MinD/ParA family protein [Anaerolineae bacterium]|nr:MinD/ParA family protein [Anaerolineae bacterium]
MPKIISIHSFRGGTGKSNTSANVAALIAARGRRVGVVDTDIQSPGIHVLLGLTENDMQHSLNDYLWGKCDVQHTAHDVTKRITDSAHHPSLSGKVYLTPSSLKAGEIAQILREGYDVGLLNDGFHQLIDTLQLDVLLIDTHPGLNEETLLSVAVSDTLVIIMRPDQQDFQGTAVTVEVARKLEVPKMMILVNKAPLTLKADEVKSETESAFDCPVVSVLHHSDELMSLASRGIFVLYYPEHKITRQLNEVVTELLA